MSLKHLAENAEFPQFTGKIRLYSMKYCPYAQRTRLVLAAKNIDYELVNINLTKKPEWFNSKVNVTGTVPVLQIDENTFIPESMIISEYIDSYYKDNRLTPTCPLENAKQKLVVESFNRVIVSFYKFYRKTEPDADKLLISALEDTVEKKLSGNYFGGENPALVDFMIWPWIERLEILQVFKDLVLEQDKFTKLFEYIGRMREQPAVKQTLNKPEEYAKFFDGNLSGNVDYDFEIGDAPKDNGDGEEKNAE